ncbi:MAG: hypothetical protein K6D95_07640 [Treponema sp.]|nr:hypothetical protein [Treponema sp.]
MKNKIILFLTGILLFSSCKNNVKADYSKGLRLNIQIGGEESYYSARAAFIPSSSSAISSLSVYAIYASTNGLAPVSEIIWAEESDKIIDLAAGYEWNIEICGYGDSLSTLEGLSLTDLVNPLYYGTKTLSVSDDTETIDLEVNPITVVPDSSNLIQGLEAKGKIELKLSFSEASVSGNLTVSCLNSEHSTSEDFGSYEINENPATFYIEAEAGLHQLLLKIELNDAKTVLETCDVFCAANLITSADVTVAVSADNEDCTPNTIVFISSDSSSVLDIGYTEGVYSYNADFSTTPGIASYYLSIEQKLGQKVSVTAVMDDGSNTDISFDPDRLNTDLSNGRQTLQFPLSVCSNLSQLIVKVSSGSSSKEYIINISE